MVKEENKSNVRFIMNQIVKDTLDSYNLEQKGKWYFFYNNSVYYDLIVNNRLGKFTYKLDNREARIYLYINDVGQIIVEDRIKIGNFDLPQRKYTLKTEEYECFKNFILEAKGCFDVEAYLNDTPQHIYGYKCNDGYIKSIKKLEERLSKNEVKVWDLEEFYTRCFAVRNYENKEVNWVFKIGFEDKDDNLQKITYIQVKFIAKTDIRIVFVYRDLVTDNDYNINLFIDNYEEDLYRKWVEIYELH